MASARPMTLDTTHFIAVSLFTLLVLLICIIFFGTNLSSVIVDDYLREVLRNSDDAELQADLGFHLGALTTALTPSSPRVLGVTAVRKNGIFDILGIQAGDVIVFEDQPQGFLATNAIDFRSKRSGVFWRLERRRGCSVSFDVVSPDSGALSHLLGSQDSASLFAKLRRSVTIDVPMRKGVFPDSTLPRAHGGDCNQLDIRL
jgi:hypothetical protein